MTLNRFSFSSKEFVIENLWEDHDGGHSPAVGFLFFFIEYLRDLNPGKTHFHTDFCAFTHILWVTFIFFSHILWATFSGIIANSIKNAGKFAELK